MLVIFNIWLSMMFPGVKCPAPSSVTNGRVTPVMAEYFYSDYIFVRCDQGLKLMMVKIPLLFCHCMNEKKSIDLVLH